MSKQYKLCYVSGNVLYFTDNFAKQWGDDWNDAPYEHNAGEPYDRKDYTEYDDDWCKKHGCGNIKNIAFLGYDGWNIKQPCDGHYNSPYSVDDINKGAVAWLYNNEAGGLMGGATIGEAIAWLKRAGMPWGELHE